jgi:F420-dependent oxidoreductase-like protein
MVLSELRTLWQFAEDAGFDHLWTFDHFQSVGQDPGGPVFEAWSLLAAMAEATERIRIGCIVTGSTFRHPGVLAKSAVTVDHLSGGRLEFGIGAAWLEHEHTMLGIEFGTPGWRADRLDEACRVLKLLWTEERSSFEGSHFVLRDAIANPKPVQKPWPPIWIGARGERKMLRSTAEHADVWNVPTDDITESLRLASVLNRHCEDIGRDPRSIRRSIQVNCYGNAEESLAKAASFAEIGFSEIVLAIVADDALPVAHGLAETALPRLRELG